jgi:hypothetical protein
VEFLGVLWIFLGVIVGVQIGARVAPYIRGKGVRLVFAIIMATVGLSILVMQMGSAGLSRLMLLTAILAICAIVVMKAIYGLVQNR